MSDVRIRECLQDDVARVRELDESWEAEDITHGYVAESAEELANHLGSCFLVAELEGCIVGFAHGSAHVSEGMPTLPPGETYFEVDAIYVETEHRNTSIGGLLLDRLLEVARDNGIERSRVHSATKDLERILRFYQRHGYKQYYVQLFR